MEKVDEIVDSSIFPTKFYPEIYDGCTWQYMAKLQSIKTFIQWKNYVRNCSYKKLKAKMTTQQYVTGTRIQNVMNSFKDQDDCMYMDCIKM